MTVEQPSLPQQNQAVDRNVVKIEEVTGGVYDRARITRAIQQCSNDAGSYELEEVIAVLLQDPPPPGATATGGGMPTRPSPAPYSRLAQPAMSRPAPPAAAPPTTPPAVPPAATPATTPPAAATDTSAGPKRRGTQHAKGVIDLTNESTSENDDLQKAIAASLQDTPPGILGGQLLSREEQEISRALEANLAENKAGTKRKRGDLWFVDPLNPHERKRKEGWPVGLKNVGNTCWFSAVIQSLFHLPVFRRLVLNFNCPPKMRQGHAAETRNLRFMHELRKLFALALRTQRKYVDPSKAVDILKEAFSTSAPAGSIDSQQDVSEFQHKLLEWLEDTFSRLDQDEADNQCEEEEGGEDSDETNKRKNNPMMKLFYGQFLAEGVNEGKSFKNEETFGQFPLQVNGFRDIYESLDAATARGEIETVNNDSTAQSRQEQWFTRLPPVLTFELSRFHFNQNLGRPEKIHNKLHFPNLIYMDRYMLANKQTTRKKREELKGLKEQLRILQGKLDKFINYGSGAKRFPLQDVLQHALQFAETPPRPTSSTAPTTPCDDVDMDSPKSTTSMQTDSPNLTPKKSSTEPTPSPPAPPRPHTDTRPGMGAPSAGDEQQPSMVDPGVNSQPPVALSGRDGQPAPRDVAPKELQVLQSCLTRWRTEVENDVKELQAGIGSLELTMGAMYSEESLKQHAYRLHAVLVHEGQAASGHYWAYVHSPHFNTWLKFNDITVSEASWHELEKESVGGYHNASAYCLMYVRATSQHLFKVVSADGDTCQNDQAGLELLPPDLDELVMEDNKRFANEMAEWDAEQQHRNLNPATPAPQQGEVKEEKAVPVVRSPPSLATQHATLVSMSTLEALRRVLSSDTFKNKGSSDAFQEVLESEMKRLEALAKSVESSVPLQDPRLYHLVVYQKVNAVSEPALMTRVVLEQFSLIQLQEPHHSLQQILNEAKKAERATTQAMTEVTLKQYKQWHLDYNEFRRTTLIFLAGVEQFHNESYASALPYLVCACEMNDVLTSRGHVMRGLDHRLLYSYRRQCVLHVNEVAAAQFESEENLTEPLDLMERLILPSIALLSNTLYEDDKSAVDEVREKWCSFLGQEVSREKIEKLQDFLAKLFDSPSEIKLMYNPTLKRVAETADLAERYRVIMKLSNDSGYIKTAAASK